MTSPILLCTDGSELATASLASGYAVLDHDRPVTILTVIEESDPSLVTGSGFAGGVMSTEELDVLAQERRDDGRQILDETAAALGLPDAGLIILEGAAGPAICSYATDLAASAIVVGTRGRSGIKRAILGSVSDHVVRNAPCPVMVVS